MTIDISSDGARLGFIECRLRFFQSFPPSSVATNETKTKHIINTLNDTSYCKKPAHGPDFTFVKKNEDVDFEVTNTGRRKSLYTSSGVSGVLVASNGVGGHPAPKRLRFSGLKAQGITTSQQSNLAKAKVSAGLA